MRPTSRANDAKIQVDDEDVDVDVDVPRGALAGFRGDARDALELQVWDGEQLIDEAVQRRRRWHCGHQKVLRAPWTMRAMGVPQRRQGSPSRWNTQRWWALSPTSPLAST